MKLHSGNLVQHVSGYFWDTNEERRFIVSGGVLNAYKLSGGVADMSMHVEAIYVDKIIGVHMTESVFEITGFSFQVQNHIYVYLREHENHYTLIYYFIINQYTLIYYLIIFFFAINRAQTEIQFVKQTRKIMTKFVLHSHDWMCVKFSETKI
jgi:hypothetical protein